MHGRGDPKRSEDPRALLGELSDAGVQLRLEDERLIVTAKRGVLTEALRERLERAKPSLLCALREQRNEQGSLSLIQEGAWLLRRLRPGSPVERVANAVALRGTLDAARLRRAVAELHGRYPVLRSRFHDGAEGPRVVLADVDQDVFECLEAEDEAEARALAEDLIVQPFDLAEGPLLRARLWSWSPDRHILVLIACHLVADGISMALLWKELLSLYEGTEAAGSSDGPRMPYPEYAAEERAAYARGDMDEGLAYWRRSLEGVAVLELPLDRRPSVGDENGADLLAIRLPEQQWSRLLDLGKSEGTSGFAAGLALFQALLSRFARAEDVTVGAAFANRVVPGTEEAIGYFSNVCALRGDLRGAPSFRELLQRTHRVLLGALEFQHIPFGLVQREFASLRDLSLEPLFRVFFAIAKEPLPTALGGARSEELRFPARSAAFDLDLAIEATEREVRAWFVYSTSLFERATIAALSEALRALLAEVVARPDRPIPELDLLSMPAREALSRDGSECPRFPGTLQEAFAAAVDRSPGALAIWSTEDEVSFGELRERADSWSAALRERGVGEGDVVALAFDRGAELVAALLGVLGAGAVFFVLDVEEPLEWQREQLGALHPRWVFGRRERIGPLRTASLPEESAIASEDLDPGKRSGPVPVLRPESPAFVVRTNGTNGTSRWILGSHATALHGSRSWAELAPFGPDEVGCQLHVASTTIGLFEILAPLLAGAPQVVLPSGALDDPVRFVRDLAEAQVSRLALHPEALRRLLASGEFLGWRLPRLRHCVVTDGPLSPNVARRFRRNCPEVRLLQVFGTAEFAGSVSWVEVSEVPRATRRLAIGRPFTGVRIEVVGRRGEPLPPGFPGEIRVAGEGLALAELRAAGGKDAWCPLDRSHPLPTGDWGRWDTEGNLEWLGRGGPRPGSNGALVNPSEIEDLLAGQGSVEHVVCLPVSGDGGVRELVAFVVPRTRDSRGGAEGATRIDAELGAFLAERLGTSHRPDRILLLDRMPTRTDGEVDRARLGREVRREMGERDGVAPSRAESPATPTEILLAGAWREFLGCDRVSRHASFFDLGGHSLAIGRLQRFVLERLGRRLEFHEVFDHPRLASLARLLDAKAESSLEAPPKAAAESEGVEAPLSLAQEWLWVRQRIEPESVALNIVLPLVLEGELDLGALAKSLDEIVARHAPLRTRFVERGGHGIRLVDPPGRVGLPFVDWTSEEASHAIPLDDLVARDLAQPFALSRGPLARFTLVRTGPAEHVLLSTFHHIVCDQASFGVFFGELGAAYSARVRGEPSPLAPLTVTYDEFARAERRRFERHGGEWLAFWKEELRDAPSPVLPTDRGGASCDGLDGRRQRFRVEAAVAEGLRALAGEEETTLFTVLLAGYALSLARRSGEEVVVLGTPLAGRGMAGTEALIGTFVNTVVMRIDLGGAADLRSVVRRVRRCAVRAQENGGLPFGTLVSELAPVRDSVRGPGRSPFFQTVFQLVPETESPALSGLSTRFLEQKIVTPVVDLNLEMTDAGGVLFGVLDYDSTLFDASTAAGFIEDYLACLALLVRAPGEAPFEELVSVGLGGDASGLLVSAEQVGRDAAESPATPTEKKLAGILAEVLGLPDVRGVVRGSGFFYLGGDSLLAMRLAYRIEAELGVRPSFQELFQSDLVSLGRSIDESVGRVAQTRGSTPPDSRCAVGIGRAALSPEQLQFWLAGLDGDPAYNVPIVLRLEGPLDPDGLETAYRTVLERHELLRARFPLEGKEPLARTLPLDRFPLRHLAVGPTEIEAELERLAATSLDLEAGPVARAWLLESGPLEHFFVLVAHHILLDQASVTLVRRDLLAAYDAELRARDFRLEPPGISFAEYAREKWGALRRDEPELLLYWREELAGAHPPDLPIASPAFDGPARGVHVVEVPLPPRLGMSVDALARASGTTPFQVWWTLSQIALATWCGGADEVLCGLPVSGRPRRELEQTVGPFFNTVLIRTRVASGLSFLDLLREAQGTLLEALAHSGLPFDRLVAALNPTRGGRRDPLLRVLVQENEAVAPQTVGLLRVDAWSLPPVRPKVELTIAFTRTGVGWSGVMEFDAGLFEHGRSRDFAEGFAGFADRIVGDPSRAVSVESGLRI